MRDAREAPGKRLSKALQQFSDCVVITRRNEYEAAFLSAKHEPDIQTRATFEIVLAKATDAQARMKVGFPEAVADGIDCLRHVAPAQFPEFPNMPPKRL
jgi:hypothetical protein